MPRVPDKDWPEEWCEMEFHGTDPEDGDYYRCTVHNMLVLGDAYVCESYQPPPYVPNAEEVEAAARLRARIGK